MKQAILILGAALCFQSYAFAAIGEADACQKETVSAAFQVSIEENKAFYITSMELIERIRDEKNFDQVKISLKSPSGKVKTVRYTFAITDEVKCDILQVGGWHKAD